MKNLLLALFLLLSAGATAQTLPPPPKGSNVIYVTLPDSSTVAWQRVAKAFVANGFALKNSDATLLTLTTEPTPVNGATELTASAYIEGSRAALRGLIDVPVLGQTKSILEYRGMRGSIYMSAWAKLYEVAKSLGGTITYGKQ